MAASSDNSGQVLSPAQEAARLFRKLVKLKNPSGEDLERLRKLIVSTPAAWPMAPNTMRFIRQTLVANVSPGLGGALMLTELDLLATRLGYDAAPAIERMLIDHLLTVRLRLVHAESAYNQHVVNQSTVELAVGGYWDNVLSSTQARFLRAVESLARVRRLARNTPALQINIAREGGKQVNIQDDANGQVNNSGHDRDGRR